MKIEKLSEDNRKFAKELKKLKSKHLMLASSDATAEAGGVPSSRTFYRRPETHRQEKVRTEKPSGRVEVVYSVFCKFTSTTANAIFRA